MNKFFKLAAIPIALALTNCAALRNLQRSVRHSIARAITKTPQRKPIATGVGCEGSWNEDASRRTAEKDLKEKLEKERKELKKTVAWIDHFEIVITPEKASISEWPNNYRENRYRSTCAFAEAFEPKPKEPKIETAEEPEPSEKLAESNQ